MSKIFEDSDENESGEDFSASEDDWQPDKASDSGESEDDDDDDFVTANETSLEEENKNKKS